MQIKIHADTADTINALKDLQKAVLFTLQGSINESTKHIQDLIYTDYRRIGESSPSYENPSKSGYGFTDRTGTLRAGIDTSLDISPGKVVGTVGSDIDYAEYVELLWSGKYAFLVPALHESSDFIYSQITDSLETAIQRAARL